MTLGEFLKNLRLSECMTQKQLSEKLNVTHNTICYYETNKQTPCLRVLKEYSDLFNIDVVKLLCLKYDNKKTKNQN